MHFRSCLGQSNAQTLVIFIPRPYILKLFIQAPNMTRHMLSQMQRMKPRTYHPKMHQSISQALHMYEDEVTQPTSKYSYLQGATRQPRCLNTTRLFIRREMKLNFSSWSCRGIQGRLKVIIQLEFGQHAGVSTAVLTDGVEGLCNDHQRCLLSHQRRFPQNPTSPWKSPLSGLRKPGPGWFGNNAGQRGRVRSITISVTFKSSKIYMD